MKEVAQGYSFLNLCSNKRWVKDNPDGLMSGISTVAGKLMGAVVVLTLLFTLLLMLLSKEDIAELDFLVSDCRHCIKAS